MKNTILIAATAALTATTLAAAAPITVDLTAASLGSGGLGTTSIIQSYTDGTDTVTATIEGTFTGNFTSGDPAQLRVAGGGASQGLGFDSPGGDASAELENDDPANDTANNRFLEEFEFSFAETVELTAVDFTTAFAGADGATITIDGATTTLLASDSTTASFANVLVPAGEVITVGATVGSSFRVRSLTVEAATTVIPEPASAGLIASALGGLMLRRRR